MLHRMRSSGLQRMAPALAAETDPSERGVMAEEVRAEIVSTVQAVKVAVGDQVHADQRLVLLDSMMMEIPVTAPIDGEVTSIVVPGQVLQYGDLIAVVS